LVERAKIIEKEVRMRQLFLVSAFIFALNALGNDRPGFETEYRPWQRAPQRVRALPRLSWDDDAAAGRRRLRALRQSREVSRLEPSVLWWNVQVGLTDRAIQGRIGGPSQLSLNLERVIRSEFGPDVVALGEYSFDSGILNRSAERALSALYPHVEFFPYRPSGRLGVIVYSRFPIDRVEVERVADRTLNSLEILKDNVRYRLMALHFSNPWHQYRSDYGVVETLREIQFGRSNSIAREVHALRRFVRGHDWRNTLIVGDLNLPKTLTGTGENSGMVALVTRLLGVVGDTQLYRMLVGRGELRNSFGTRESPSFPAWSAHGTERHLRVNWAGREWQFDQSLKIDHSFHTRDLRIRSASVLPMRGSDHYPLWVQWGRR
jgi:endonuclease/exonuclease/phosphatase family metal-dependent hydrolase